MSKANTIPYETIIAALISNGTIKATAEALGMGERTIYDRMKKPEFEILYEETKANIIRKAVFDCNGKLEKAIATIADIMEDDGNNPAIRLQAAQMILNTASKFAERLNNAECRADVTRLNARRR